MKDGQTDLVMDWPTLLHQVLATAFIVKGITLLLRE